MTVVDVGDEDQQTTDEGISVITLRASKLQFVGNLITRLRMRNWLATRFRAGEIDIIELADYPGFLSFPIRGCPTVVRLHQSKTLSGMSSVGLKRPKGVWFYEKLNLIA